MNLPKKVIIVAYVMDKSRYLEMNSKDFIRTAVKGTLSDTSPDNWEIRVVTSLEDNRQLDARKS